MTGVPLWTGFGENATSLRDFLRMVTIGRADYVQPAMVKLGITAMAKIATEVEQADAAAYERLLSETAFLAVLHCIAVKDKVLRSSGCLPILALLRS